MRLAPLVASLALFASAAQAEEFHVKEIRAYLFFSHTGQLSENIVGSKKSFHNTIIGEGDAGGAASNVLVDVTLVNGDKPGGKEPASLKVTYKSQGKDMSVTRTYDNSVMEAGEVVHQSVLLENATCFPMTIEAKAGKGPGKSATIKFGCGE